MYYYTENQRYAHRCKCFQPKQSSSTIQQQYDNNNSKASVLSSTSPTNSVERRVPQPAQSESNVSKPQLVFHCQLAHGSPTGLISGFASVKELYQKIAECYDFSVDEVGDHIEKLDNVNVVGKRHYEVARMLKDIPTGSTFTLRLVEPMKSGFQGIGPRSGPKGANKKGGYGSGKETLRFKANGNAAIEDEHDESTQVGIDAINSLLDSFMGINDAELATQIWDLGLNKTNSMDFAEAVDSSDLEAFGFTDDFIIELWGAITDARQGRYKT
ncbi:PDZ domain-containing protein GIPC1 [Pseudolycoriella hygida]|uniref:PDZ domain-containing protein GIPC1 n=1 Tax=Pseudolycoriella hygida TaxID=35572 RepID=A0A9Q0N507_9DIPT|nr:PDZ domain-containing protein GIPC1 [Pseudolycoriella hygida]